MADGMSAKFMKNAFVGWTMTAGTYYPPDFDASKLMPVKHLRPKGVNPEMRNIRMMFPFTMICDHCGEYNYTGTKFTAKVEPIKSEMYLSLKVYRFYGHCKHCWSEFTFKTDPKNSDYSMESGGRRTYEAWKDADMAEMQLKQEKQRDAEQDAMKALEQKSIDVQAEIQRIEDLDAIRTLNKRNGARDLSIQEALDFVFKRKEEEAREESEVRLQDGDVKELELFLQDRQDHKQQEEGNDEAIVEKKLDEAIAAAVANRASSQAGARPGVGAKFVVKRKAPETSGQSAATPASTDTGGSEPSSKRQACDNAVPDTTGSTNGLLGAYDSSEDE